MFEIETFITEYVKVRVELEYETDGMTEEEAIQEAVSEMDYKMVLNGENLKIKKTEIIDILD